MPRYQNLSIPSKRRWCNDDSSPSGAAATPKTPNCFESCVQAQLQKLVGLHYPPKSSRRAFSATERINRHTARADTASQPSFAVPHDEDDDDDDEDDDDHINPDIASEARFMRNSIDNINTRFVAQDTRAERYQFSAGSPVTPGEPPSRTKQRSRSAPRGRQSPPRTAFAIPTATFVGATQQPDPAAQKQSGFFPEQWSEIGPQNFVPPPTVRPSVSPTRHGRLAKKPKPVRMTAGTAGMVDDDETSGEDKSRPAPATANVNGVPSPNAMDIDTPPPAPAAPRANGARAVNVEPSKPEWRAGDVNGVKPEPAVGNGLNMPKVNPAAAGSEDTEDISRPVFPEFLKEEPFLPKPAGLAGWADVKTNLPFESQPSTKLPFEAEKPKPKHPPVELPAVPKAPVAPPALAIKDLKPSPSSWHEYVLNFEKYLREWANFEKDIIIHFSTRRKAGAALGEKRFQWVSVRGDQGIQQYLQEREQDDFVRAEWNAACVEHSQKVLEFSKYRDKMKQAVPAP